MTGQPQPPRWAEALLRVCLPKRGRDAVIGDLLEEYRVVILPARGQRPAQLWYVRQTLSLVPGVALGVILGSILGLENLVVSWISPLSDDTPRALLIFYGPMFAAWGVASFAATRRSGRLIDAIKIGATLGLVTIVVLSFANLIRVNLFLDDIQHRLDWRNMMVRFQQSDFDSLRAFVNYDYATGFWSKVLFGGGLGATIGAIGGLPARLMWRSTRR